MKRIGLSLLLAVVTVLVVLLGGAPANAAPVAPVPALVPCPPGAPPMSSLCSPAGWALAIEAGTATTSQAAAAGVAGFAPTTAAAATVSGGPAAIAAGTAVAVGITDFAGGTATVDTTATDLYVRTANEAGWAPGPAVALPGGYLEFDIFFDPATKTGNVTYTAVGATWVGKTASISSDVLAFFAGSASTWETKMFSVKCHTSTSWTQPVSANLMTDGNVWKSNGVGFDSKTSSFVCPTQTVDVTLDFPGTAPNTLGTPNAFWRYSVFEVEKNDVGMTGDMVTEYTCRDGAGVESVGSVTVAVASSLPEVPVELPAVQCPAGSVLVGLTVTWVTTDGEQILYDYTAPEWVYDIPVEYPGCVGGECTIQLWRIFSDGAPAEWCGVAGVGCQSWWADANKAQNYECRYGPYAVDLGLCAIYRKPGSVSTNAPVIYDPSGRPIGIGQPVISTDPDDFKIFDPKPGPEPEPIPDPEPEPLPQTGQCFPSGWGVFNPVEWVYRPVVCAISWAWLPPSPPTLDDTSAAFDGSIIGGLVDELDDLRDVEWPSGSSCTALYEGAPSVLQGESLTVTTCGPIASDIAAIVRPLLSGLFWLGGALLALQVVLRAFDIDLLWHRTAGKGGE